MCECHVGMLENSSTKSQFSSSQMCKHKMKLVFNYGAQPSKHSHINQLKETIFRHFQYSYWSCINQHVNYLAFLFPISHFHANRLLALSLIQLKFSQNLNRLEPSILLLFTFAPFQPIQCALSHAIYHPIRLSKSKTIKKQLITLRIRAVSWFLYIWIADKSIRYNN